VVFGAGDDAGQRVVVLRRDRVELVVVAAGARHRQAEEGARQGVDAVVVLVELLGVAVVDGAEREEAQRWQPLQAVGAVVHGVGGRPIRSKYARRMRARLSAASMGRRLFSSSLARTK